MKLIKLTAISAAVLASIVKELINRHTAIRNKRTVCQRNLAATLYVFV